MSRPSDITKLRNSANPSTMVLCLMRSDGFSFTEDDIRWAESSIINFTIWPMIELPIRSRLSEKRKNRLLQRLQSARRGAQSEGLEEYADRIERYCIALTTLCVLLVVLTLAASDRCPRTPYTACPAHPAQFLLFLWTKAYPHSVSYCGVLAPLQMVVFGYARLARPSSVLRLTLLIVMVEKERNASALDV
jgi:hypothetical protein